MLLSSLICQKVKVYQLLEIGAYNNSAVKSLGCSTFKKGRLLLIVFSQWKKAGGLYGACLLKQMSICKFRLLRDEPLTYKHIPLVMSMPLWVSIQIRGALGAETTYLMTIPTKLSMLLHLFFSSWSWYYWLLSNSGKGYQNT